MRAFHNPRFDSSITTHLDICLIDCFTIINVVMNIDNYTKRFIIHRLKWIGLFFGIGLVLGLLLPFPYDFISVLGVFFLVNFLRGRSILKRYGGFSGIKDMLGSLSSSMSNNNQQPLKYYCMVCGKEHREIACPNCGSKMKRVG
jgi:hypothetical protein